MATLTQHHRQSTSRRIRRLRALAARRFVCGFDGTVLPAEVARLLHAGLGGIILFARNLPDIESAVALIRSARAAAGRRSLVVCLDQEGGRVKRLGPPLLQLPSARILGATGDRELLRAAGRQLGRELGALGFSLNLAPVLDVDTNPKNPVIGDRSFARDPREAARRAVAFGRGLLLGGIACCGKHFPGHGDTRQDSHHELPTLPADQRRLETVELVPFAAAIRARFPALMLGHLLAPALDPKRPASLSPAAYQLTRRMGHAGALLTDDLEMGAVARSPGVVPAALEALRCGADGALICHRPGLVEEAIERTTRKLVDGIASERTFAASARRLAALGSVAAPDQERFLRFTRSPRRRAVERVLASLSEVA